jgi:hypothetical protein
MSTNSAALAGVLTGRNFDIDKSPTCYNNVSLRLSGLFSGVDPNYCRSGSD